MRRALLLLTVLAPLLLGGCATGTPTFDPRPAPELRGDDFDGEHWELDNLEGSVVVVSIWASWCGPCRDEVPVLSQAQQRLGPDGLTVLGVNFRDHPDAARDFLEEEQPAFPSVVDTDGTIAVDWGVSALPQSFLVDRDGQVVARHFGAVTDDWIDDVVVPEVQQ